MQRARTHIHTHKRARAPRRCCGLTAASSPLRGNTQKHRPAAGSRVLVMQLKLRNVQKSGEKFGGLREIAYLCRHEGQRSIRDHGHQCLNRTARGAIWTHGRGRGESSSGERNSEPTISALLGSQETACGASITSTTNTKISRK